MSVLQEICDRKQEHVLKQKALKSLATLEQEIQQTLPPKEFIARIQDVSKNDSPALITEVKKASPSKGLIRENFTPEDIAKAYQASGAACVSVLTDTPYFQGTDEHFQIVREAISLPMIRKDFMVDPYQIYESRALGADCILLIMAALSDLQAQELYALSGELGMDVLVETHDREEIERASQLKPVMIGVNNRNLKTLNVDVQTSFDLLQHIPSDTVKIAESGLSDFETLSNLQQSGYAGFLVGESLMRQDDIENAARTLRGK